MKKFNLLVFLGIGLSSWMGLSFSAEKSLGTAITIVTIIDALNVTLENQTLFFKN